MCQESCSGSQRLDTRTDRYKYHLSERHWCVSIVQAPLTPWQLMLKSIGSWHVAHMQCVLASLSKCILYCRLQACNHLLQRGWSQFPASGWSSGVQTEPSSAAIDEICPGLLEKSFGKWCFGSWWRSTYYWNFNCGANCKSVRQCFLCCTLIRTY